MSNLQAIIRSRNWMADMASILVVVLLGAILQMVVLPEPFHRPKITEWGRLLHLGIWTAIMMPMVVHTKQYLLVLLMYVAIFVSAAYVPFLDGLNVGSIEVASAYLFGASWFLFWTSIYGITKKSGSDSVRRLICGLSYAALTVPILMPLLVWGYWAVSGGYVLSSAIVLTLFQTNFAESAAYLKAQNPLLWFFGLSGLLLAMSGAIKGVRTALHADILLPRRPVVFFFLVFMGVGIYSVNADVGKYLPVRIGVEVQGALEDYRAYGRGRELREERLKELQALKNSSAGGDVRSCGWGI